MGFIKFKLVKDEEEKPIKVIKIGKDKQQIKRDKPRLIEKLKRKSFVLNWEQELGYAENPFKAGILGPVSDFIAGYEKERNKINLFIINNGMFGVIKGEDGVGKTTLLRWLYEQLQQYKDKVLVYYLTGKALSRDFTFIKTMVNPLLSMYEQKIKKLNEDVDVERNLSLLKEKLGHKKLILLIDDIFILPDNVLLLIKRMYSVMPLQIIISCNNNIAQYLNKLEWLKDTLKIQLEGMASKEIKLMMKKRIRSMGGDDIFPFEDKDIQNICKKASHNPKQALYLFEAYAKQLSVQQIEIRRKRKEAEDAKRKQEPEKIEKEINSEEEEKEVSIDVPELKEIPKKTDYRIDVVNQGSDAIYVDHKDKDYKFKHVEKK